MSDNYSIKRVSDDASLEDSRMVTRVSRLHIEEAATEVTDEFNKPATTLKSMGGVDSNFKRKVTNTLNKALSNADGSASSKQIEEQFTGYDAFDVAHPPYDLDTLAKLYEKSAPHHAAVEAKVSNIVGLGFRFVETVKTKQTLEDFDDQEDKLKKARRKLDQHREELYALMETFNEDETMTEILMKVWRDYEVTGNGYLEVGRKRDGTIGYLGHIPAQSIRIRKKRDGFVQVSGWRVQYFKPFGDSVKRNPIGDDVPNEIIHLKKTSPNSSYYGVPDIVAAQQAIAGNEFAARFNLDYFENKAIPRHIIIAKGFKLGNQAEADLLSFFETNLRGQNHRSLIIPLPSGTKDEPVDFKIEPVEAGVQDASFANYKKINDKEILMVHRVPETKISTGGGVNLAVARDADKTFKEQVCAPEQKIFEKKLNRIVKEFTDAFEFKLNEMTLTDADTQSKIDERMIKVGAWLPNEIRTRDGMPTIKGGSERVDLNAKDKIAQAQAELTTQRERDSARSSNATDSNGEGRNTKGDGRAQG